MEFAADDSGYCSDASILLPAAAEEACQQWCRKKEVVFNGLQDYESEDDNGFFYSFSVTEVIKGAVLSTGQWR